MLSRIVLRPPRRLWRSLSSRSNKFVFEDTFIMKRLRRCGQRRPRRTCGRQIKAMGEEEKGGRKGREEEEGAAHSMLIRP